MSAPLFFYQKLTYLAIHLYKVFVLLSGSAQWLNKQLTPLQPLDIVNSVLRGISQLIFINNPFAGACIVLILFVDNSYLAVMGLLGCTLTTSLAIYNNFSTQDIRNGIFGFGGALVGFALSVIVERVANEQLGLYYLSLFIFPLAYLNIVIIKKIGFAFSRRSQLPFFTLPYNMTIFLFISLFMSYSSSVLTNNGPLSTSNDINVTQTFAAVIVTLGQVYFIENFASSLALVIVLIFFSPLIALLAGIGATTFILLALALNFDGAYITNGLIGFNVALTAIVVGSVVMLFSYFSVFSAFIASLWSSVISIIISYLLLPLGFPVLTLPFCTATISFIFILKRKAAHCFVKNSSQCLAPEEELYLHWCKRKKTINPLK